MAPVPEQSLAGARAFVMERRFRPEGTVCPCCDGIAKVYPRKFNKTLARILMVLARWDVENSGQFHHVKNEWQWANWSFNAEYARMVDLGLIEEPAEGRADGNPNTGFHRITHKGVRFVKGEITIPERVFCYKGKVIDESPEQINIYKAIGYEFKYSDLFAVIGKD